MVTSFGLLFRPSSDHASFRIKEKPNIHLNVKMGRDLVSLRQIYVNFKPERVPTSSKA